jgi:pimeloyl-ACP methyl ester carboxylesterase
VLSLEDTLMSEEYDEFGLLYQNAAEWDIPFDPPMVSRGEWESSPGQGVSYLRWGEDDPEFVFLHGGGQNAHTWDTVLLALGRSAIAIDLPGHGHSDRRADRDYGPWRNAEVVAAVTGVLAPRARCVIGMSLGGATLFRFAAERPDLCSRAVFVDVTPQINDLSRELTTAERGTVSLIAEAPVYDTFGEMADAAVALSPHRAAAGVRRGVRHNARRLADGRWTWRYDLFGPAPGASTDHSSGSSKWVDFTPLWQDVDAITVPALFVRGALSPFVRDDDIAEMQNRLTSLEVVTVEGAGHAVQSDQPLILAELIRDFAG